MNIESSNFKEQEPTEYAEIKAFLREFFVKKDEGKMEDVYAQIRAFATAANMDADEIISNIREYWQSPNPDEFVAHSFTVLKKLIDYRIAHPELVEQIRRERRLTQTSGNIRLSELMYYDVDHIGDGVALLHIAPKGNLNVRGILKSFRDGMKELAKQVDEDKRIKEIQATSWIIASNPGLLEKAGFTVEGSIDEKMREEHFSGETRPVSWAHIGRDELLKRYLPTHS